LVGKKLGHYEVLGPLGAGGMGEVYRARDTKLDRDVALKVLPEDFATDRDRLARFEREAKLLASLNHANIAAIYGLEDEGDQRFIVMEVVEGESLAEMIARCGSIEVDEALEIARQVAEALEAAHESGVIHRDLKPGNIMVTPAGKVKVLDFGLAKAYAPDGSPSEISPDLSASPTVAAATGAGMIMGTAAYMSPEHARGKPVDRRTDIWAFGCVLYEMLTGRCPFAGESLADVFAAVVKEEPDESLLPAETPDAIRHLLHRCLSKDPRQRLQHMGDARLELVDPRPDAPDVTAPATGGGRYSTGTLVLVGVMAALLSATAMWVASTAPEPVPPRSARFPFMVPDGLRIVADDPGQDGPWLPYPPFALSADGRRLAFRAVASAGEPRLYVRDQDDNDVRALQGTANAHLPFFSPDGAWVGFWRGGELFKVSVDGGPPVRIATMPRRPRGAAWAPDDTIFLGGFNRGLSTVSAAGGSEVVEITTLDRELGHHYHAWPSMLPDGSGVLFTAVEESGSDLLAVYSLESESHTPCSSVPAVCSRRRTTRNNRAWSPAPCRFSRSRRDGTPGCSSACSRSRVAARWCTVAPGNWPSRTRSCSSTGKDTRARSPGSGPGDTPTVRRYPETARGWPSATSPTGCRRTSMCTTWSRAHRSG